MADTCERCSHPSDPHAVVATTFRTVAGVEEVPVGGVILCPKKGCQCYATWSMPQSGVRYEDLVIPDRAELERMREEVQND